MHDLDRTLVAIATPPGRGGIGALRVSGPDALEIAGRLFRPNAPRRQRVGGAPLFGQFLDTEGRRVDHGYLVVFGAGSAFTGEPTAELWTHGSPAVQRALLDAAIAAGAVAAGPGEFTYRALRHGRLDLARAEAVRDLVAARTTLQARVALAQAEGALSRRLAPLRERLADLIARTEAAVEFADESETHLERGVLERALASLEGDIRALLDGFRSARIIREGAVVALTGAPNVGKSSVFNKLLERERAIVSEHPGTTRDTLEEGIDLAGVPVRLIDTAGLREDGDAIESEGVRRARAAAARADLVVLILDGSRPCTPAEREALARREPGCVHEAPLVVINKTDLPSCTDPAHPVDAVRTSALSGGGIDALRDALRQAIVGREPLEDPLLTDARHAAALREAGAALERAAAAAASGLGEELVVEDLRAAIDRFAEITGEFASEELYDRIFSTFCIGK